MLWWPNHRVRHTWNQGEFLWRSDPPRIGQTPMGTTSFVGQTSHWSFPEDKSGGQAKQNPAVGLATQLGSTKRFDWRVMGTELGGKRSVEMGPKETNGVWCPPAPRWCLCHGHSWLPLVRVPCPHHSSSKEMTVSMEWHVHLPIGGTSGTEMGNSMQIFLEQRVLGILSYMPVDFSTKEVLIPSRYHSGSLLESGRMWSNMGQWESTQTTGDTAKSLEFRVTCAEEW